MKTENIAPCISEEVCKVMKRIVDRASRIDYGTLEVSVRNGKISHFDIKEIINTRISGEFNENVQQK